MWGTVRIWEWLLSCQANEQRSVKGAEKKGSQCEFSQWRKESSQIQREQDQPVLMVWIGMRKYWFGKTILPTGSFQSLTHTQTARWKRFVWWERVGNEADRSSILCEEVDKAYTELAGKDKEATHQYDDHIVRVSLLRLWFKLDSLCWKWLSGLYNRFCSEAGAAAATRSKAGSWQSVEIALLVKNPKTICRRSSLKDHQLEYL